jgi:hypothetical protein
MGEFDLFNAPVKAKPVAAPDDFSAFDAPVGADKSAPGGLSRQTGKRFIEPPDEADPATEQIAALGVAPDAPRWKPGAAAEFAQAKQAFEDAPKAPERLVRNISQGAPVIGPYTDELAALMEAPFSKHSYTEIRDEHRRRNEMTRQDAPIESMITQTGAGLVGGGPLFKGAKTASDMAMRAAALGGVEGAGRSEHDLTKGDLPGVLKDAGYSAAVSGATAGLVSKVIRGAPERVNEHMLEGISRGEAGGAAKDKLFKKLAVKAGEDIGELDATLGRFPGLKRVLSVNGPSNPRKAAEAVQDQLSVTAHKLKPIYERIDSGPAVPQAQGLYDSLTALRDRVKAEGSTGMAEVVERFQQHLAKHYGDGDAIIQGTPLPASALRNLRKEVGEIAFSGDASLPTPFKKQAQQLIYGAINDTIEKAAAKTPGVDVGKLRELNKDASILITVLDPLTDRAAKAAAGRTGFGTAVSHAVGPMMLGAAGFGAHGGSGAIEGVIAGTALLAAKKALGPTIRASDYQLSKLALAARNGSKPAQIAQLGAELGLSRVVADQIAAKLAATIFPDDGATPAQE